MATQHTTSFQCFGATFWSQGTHDTPESFTLEMQRSLIVLAIAGVALAFAANALQQSFQQNRVRDAAISLATDLQNLRSNAWRTNTTTQLDLINATSYSFTINGRTITRNLPSGIAIDGGGSTQVRYSAPNAENTQGNPVVFTLSGTIGT